MNFSTELLPTLLGFELENAKRYGRYLSLLRLESGADGLELRVSDAVFADGTVLLGETDKSGAIVALERIHIFQETPSKAAIVTFPFDGFEVAELLGTLHNRLEKAKSMSIAGAVITNGCEAGKQAAA